MIVSHDIVINRNAAPLSKAVMRPLCECKFLTVHVQYNKAFVFANKMQRARLAQSVEHETLNLRVVGSSPTLGAIIFSFD